jgi:hypothetical protein
MVEHGIMVGRDIPGVHEMFRDDAVIARIAQLKWPSHEADGAHGGCPSG